MKDSTNNVRAGTDQQIQAGSSTKGRGDTGSSTERRAGCELPARNMAGMTYEEWMREVNRIVLGISGLGVDDIGDAPYRDRFDDSVAPHDMAREALELADFPFEED